MIDLVYQYSGDAELKQLVGDFLTRYWAEWEQKEISGVLGGPKTRHKGIGGYGSDASLATTYLGGPGNGDIWWYWKLLNDYEYPPVVWNMALDRQGLGEFVYQSRGIGEEQNLWRRPLAGHDVRPVGGGPDCARQLRRRRVRGARHRQARALDYAATASSC